MADNIEDECRQSPAFANVIVTSQSPTGVRVLLLHPSDIDYYDGDWSWGPPGGGREPGEDITGCAARELFEETGIVATPRPVDIDYVKFAVFHLDVVWETPVRLSFEHTKYEWVDVDQAIQRCKPESLRNSVMKALTYAGAIQDYQG